MGVGFRGKGLLGRSRRCTSEPRAEAAARRGRCADHPARGATRARIAGCRQTSGKPHSQPASRPPSAKPRHAEYTDVTCARPRRAALRGACICAALFARAAPAAPLLAARVHSVCRCPTTQGLVAGFLGLFHAAAAAAAALRRRGRRAAAAFRLAPRHRRACTRGALPPEPAHHYARAPTLQRLRCRPLPRR